MDPNVIWAGVVVLIVLVVAGLWLLDWATGRRDVMRAEDVRAELMRFKADCEAASAQSAAAYVDLTRKVEQLEADLKPIKTKFSAGQFGAIGGGR